MATGALSSLGIGSSVLTYDVIDKLKAADQEALIDPVDEKIEDNLEQQTELATFMGTLSSLYNKASTLSEASTYLERSSSVTGDEVEATVGAGLALQDINIEVEQLASRDIYEVGAKFSGRDDVFSSKNSTLNFTLDKTAYEIDIQANSTLETVAQQITDATDGNVVGLILKTGGDDPYQLMIQSTETGAANKIYFGTTTSSDQIDSGEIAEITTGNLELTFKDTDGNDVTLDVTMDATDEENDSSDNADALLSAIRDSFTGTDLEDLLFDPDNTDAEADRNKPIHIALADDGKSLIINDTRGYDISINDVNDVLGIDDTEIGETHTIKMDDFRTGTYEGKIKLQYDGVDYTLDLNTDSGNSAAENATAIKDAIDALGITDVSTEVEDDVLRITGADGQIGIFAYDDGTSDEQDTSEELIADLNLNQGFYVSNSDLLENQMGGLDNIQTAQDAEILYNDIRITRSGNYIDDIVSGLSIELNKIHEDGESSTISVSEDTENLISEVTEFVEIYNEVLTNVAEYTKYDPETEVTGIFYLESDIRGIRSELNNILLNQTADGNSLFDFGIYLEEDGSLTLDEEKLEEKFNEDLESAEDFFRGYTGTVNGREQEFEGVFVQFRDALEMISEDENSSMKLFQNELENEYDAFQEEREKNLDRITTNYEIMAARFAAYDTLIAQINSNFQSLQMQIDQAAS